MVLSCCEIAAKRARVAENDEVRDALELLRGEADAAARRSASARLEALAADLDGVYLNAYQRAGEQRTSEVDELFSAARAVAAIAFALQGDLHGDEEAIYEAYAACNGDLELPFAAGELLN